MPIGFSLLQDAPVSQGVRVLVRADFDVAVRAGRIADAARIEAVLPAIRFLLQKGALIRVLSHRGRPGGARAEDLTLAPVAHFLSRALERPVRFIEDPFSDPVERDAPVALFENLRFWPGEEDNDPTFAASLAAQGELYVNEAFANCHRLHASMAALPRRLLSFAGFHLMKEVAALERVSEYPARPLVAVLGGVKTETKLPLIRRFLRDADRVLVGGALANTIVALRGSAIGKSVAPRAGFSSAALPESEKLFLPSDAVVADRLAADALCRVRAIGEVHEDEYIADIGPGTRALFADLLAGARTVVWNGPMGCAEIPTFAKGTWALAQAIQRLDAFTVVGGGDTVAVLKRRNLLAGFSHVSTGGGAMLSFLSGEKLPALEALREKR